MINKYRKLFRLTPYTFAITLPREILLKLDATKFRLDFDEEKMRIILTPVAVVEMKGETGRNEVRIVEKFGPEGTGHKEVEIGRYVKLQEQS